jgi:hypothetical protein
LDGDAIGGNSNGADVTRIASQLRTRLANDATDLGDALVEKFRGRFRSLFYFNCSCKRWSRQAEYQQEKRTDEDA